MNIIGYRFNILKSVKTAITAVLILNARNMLMKAMAALEVKNSFGKFLTAAQRESVSVSKISKSKQEYMGGDTLEMDKAYFKNLKSRIFQTS